MKGLTHIYYGDGKGKTTAAVGLSIRAAGAGLRVVFCKFLKSGKSGEDGVLESVPNLHLLKVQNHFGFYHELSKKEQLALASEHNQLLQKVQSLVDKQLVDLLILDEIAAAYDLGALNKPAVDNLIMHKPLSLELVLTGRNPQESWLNGADYVSHIQAVKHPYEKGVNARKGIEW